MEFDPTRYPRTYPATFQWRLFFTGLGILIGAGFPYGDLSASGRGTSTFGSHSLLWVVPLPVVGIYLIFWVRRFKVILLPDAIVSERLFSTRRLMRSEIEKRRFIAGNRDGAFSQIVLIPHDRNTKRLPILLILDNDDLFHAWLAAIPTDDNAVP
jgi:hypothetical protein